MRLIIREVKEWLRIHQDSLLTGLDGVDDDFVNDLLDNRDSDPFDSQWVIADGVLEEYKKSLNSTAVVELNRFSAMIGKKYYSMAIKKTHSSDLAGYVSDDFRLICETLACSIGNTFVFSLVGTYLAGGIPKNGLTLMTTNPTRLY